MLNVKYVKTSELKPYENNSKIHTDEQVEMIKKSIVQYGFNDPIAVWKDGTIIEGHGRYMAAQLLGLDTVPVIHLDELTDEQRKAYTIVHNQTNLTTGLDMDVVIEELKSIDIDLSDFDLSIPEFDISDSDFDDDDDGYYGDAREKTNNAYNLGIIDYDALTNDFWQMPVIENDNYIPSDLIGFNFALSSDNKKCGIHFYVDDYQFERIWNNPDKYIDVLSEYECILSPDFSLYMDMPMAMKIWNIYRSRMIGQYYQSKGIKVIPTMSWAEKETFEFCFKGIPEHSVVSVSTVGVKRDKDALQIWYDGMDEMIKQIKPSTILVYGGKLDYDYGDIKVIYFENKVLEDWKGRSN